MTTDAVAPHRARRIWQYLEPLHAVVYFAPEVQTALASLGLKGFWMSYFAQRAAPMGPVGPALVEATFYNFAPTLVHRAVPDAWRFASPDAVLATRAAAAAAVLRSLVPGVETEAARIVPLLSSVVRAGRPDGRPLFAANQSIELPADPVAALWQVATSLREHRGDVHVALLVAEDLSGIDAHQLVVGAGLIGDERLRSVRGWTEAEWASAKGGLVSRGLLDTEGELTPAGRELHARIEDRTDQLADQPYVDGLTEAGLGLLPGLVRPLARAISSAGVIPFPNPIGAPEPS